MSSQYLKKKLEMKLIFLHTNKHQSFLQVDFKNLGIKNSQSAQSNKFTISLQYLKKEVRNGVHFLHADKHQSFYKLALSFLMEVASYVQSTQNRNLVIFLQDIKKNYRNCFCVLFWCRTFRYFMGVNSCLLLLFWVDVAKNGCSLLDHRTLKSAVYISTITSWNELIFCMQIKI